MLWVSPQPAHLQQATSPEGVSSSRKYRKTDQKDDGPLCPQFHLPLRAERHGHTLQQIIGIQHLQDKSNSLKYKPENFFVLFFLFFFPFFVFLGFYS